ncbi:putative lipoprotein [Pseudomonas saudimassiliensis]|uniref:Putative lipoprotein n=1 Tax=Pseudomonas saudimassiliensis TaxID=1461581 RepID=A0A078MI76_9PSED|nr:hypothetical protein [Pseudomonas saudimassiliensis]CEA06015.1 putative lipoprotein [Pseudomonas saudimassiliensis]CEF27445.1 putative lipoprotein [Pseudomonas saudimassiliensis]
MAYKTLLLLFALLAGCVQSPPAPLAADLARIALDSSPRADMRAYRVDGELVRQLRFPDLEPGLRQLQVRYRFDIPGGMGGLGQESEPRRRSCILGVAWDLAGGQQYRFTAYRLGWQPVGWLETAAGERLVRAQVIRCGPGV